MENRSNTALLAFLKHYHRDNESELLKYLPTEEVAEIQKLNIAPPTEISSSLDLASVVITRMHYSWIVPLFQFYPKNYHPFLASCLTFQQAEGVERLMDCHWKRFHLTPISHRFFIHQLFLALGPEKPLPFSLFAESKLNVLYHFSKNQIIKLADLLSMHDLATELRQVIDSTLINKIHSILSMEQKKYLNICLRHREPIDIASSNILSGKKTAEEIKRILHQRGLSRLGAALASEHYSLMWYISRILDIGRGMLLQCSVFNVDQPWVKQALQDQVVNLIRLFPSIPSNPLGDL